MDDVFFDVILVDGCVCQLSFVDVEAFFKAGFSRENIEKLKGSAGYKSALYLKALNNVH